MPTLEVELGVGNPALEKKAPAEVYEPANNSDVPLTPAPQAAPVTMGITIPEISTGASHEYTVQSGDTLQKISQKLYGTTKKWHKLYLLNKDILKSPDKIHPGMVIKVIGKEQP